MSYRDDRDALASRVDALERELGEAKQALGEATRERDAARAEVERLGAELDDAKKRIARLAGTGTDLRGRAPRWAPVGAAVAGVALLGVMVAMCANRSPKMKEAKPAPPATTVRATPPDAAVADPDQALRDKLLRFRACTEHPDVQLRMGLRRYREQVDVAAGRVSGWMGRDGIFEVAKNQYCLEELPQAVAKAPALPALDAAGTAYHAQVVKLVALTRKIDQYYLAEDYKDDGFARGRQYHAELEAALPAFMAASDELRARVAEAWVPLMERTRDRMQQRGLEGDVLALAVGRQADVVLELLLREDTTLEQLTAELEALDAAMTAVMTWLDARPAGTAEPVSASYVRAYGPDARRDLRGVRDRWGRAPASSVRRAIDQLMIQVGVQWHVLDASLAR
jgi:hypothetical protein